MGTDLTSDIYRFHLTLLPQSIDKMQSSELPEKKCSICDKVTSRHCKNCSCSLYCSNKCQKTDWPQHKMLCDQFKNFSTRPNKSARRAIFFPEKEKNAKFIWVTCVWRSGEHGDPGFEDVDVKGYIGDDLGRTIFQRNLLRSRDLDNTIQLIYRDAFLKDGSGVNRSIIEVTKGLMSRSWRGPVLVFKKEGLGMDPDNYGDMDTVDFRDAIDFFSSVGDLNLGDMRLDDVKHSEKAPDGVCGVRISCDGDLACGRKKFEAIDVPRNHPVFREPVTSISKLIGLPIKVKRCPPDKSLLGKEYKRSNQAATFLHLNANPKDQSWGWASMDWQEPAGSVIVVRDDGKKLLPQHMDALCHFCRFIMQPIFEDSIGCGMHPEDPINKAQVLARMTPREFENFYSGYDSYKRDSDPHWISVGHPC